VSETRPSSSGDETALLERLVAQDESAFAELVRLYHGSLVRVARLFVATVETAEEVVQETWLAVITGVGRFEGRSTLKTWIFRILMNRARTRAVRDKRTVSLADLSGDGDQPEVDADRFRDDGHWAAPPRAWTLPGPEGDALRGELRQALEKAIESLPEMQAAVITLRDVQGWTSEETCNALDVSETNQRVLLHRARSRVRRALEALYGPAK